MERLIGIFVQKRSTRLFNSTVVIFSFLAVLISGVEFPRYDWDLIGYVASAYKADGLDGKELKAAVYEDVLNEVGGKEFSVLTGGGEYGKYRAMVYQDPQALEEQIPFYSIRLLYLAAIKFLYFLGGSYSYASCLASTLFASLCVLAVSGILAQQRIPQIFLPVILVFSGLPDVGRYATPDSLACLFSLGLVFFFLKKNTFSLVLAALLPLVRTDFILLSLLFAVAAYWFLPRKWVVLSAGVAVVLYVAVNKVNGNYGYLTIFNFTFLGFDPYPASMKISTDVGEYAGIYAKGLAQAVLHPHFLAYFLALVSLLNGFWARGRLDEVDCILIVSAVFVVCHLALFPAYWDRFFLFSVIVALVYMIKRPRMLAYPAEDGRMRTS
ncbi:hypothetical protein [Azotobacter armeniacus]